MPNWKTLSNYEYLGAYSLDGITKELRLTIKSIGREEVTGPNGKKDFCIVARFTESNVKGVEVKPMVLNKTNCKAIEKAYGTGDIDEWVGKKITVYSTTTKFQRDIVPCLRVKDTKPEFICSVCGKVIDEKIYDGSIAKYGRALCSAECVAKAAKEEAAKEETQEENKENN